MSYESAECGSIISTNPIKMLDRYVNKVIDMHKPRRVVIFFPGSRVGPEMQEGPIS
jgi:hypothetical protein